jgi:hypothetical protein
MVFPRLYARNANRKWTYASRWLAGLPVILLLFEAQRKQVFGVGLASKASGEGATVLGFWRGVGRRGGIEPPSSSRLRPDVSPRLLPPHTYFRGFAATKQTEMKIVTKAEHESGAPQRESRKRPTNTVPGALNVDISAPAAGALFLCSRHAATESATPITISTNTTVANQVATGAVQSRTASPAVSVRLLGKPYASGSLSGFESMTFYSLAIAFTRFILWLVTTSVFVTKSETASNAPVQITLDAAVI